MDTFITGFYIVVILFNYAMTFVMATKNFLSHMLFKVLPFAIGTSALFLLLVKMGWMVKI